MRLILTVYWKLVQTVAMALGLPEHVGIKLLSMVWGEEVMLPGLLARKSSMIRVTVLKDSLGIKIVHGTIEFFCVSVRSRSDYRCSRPNLVGFEIAKRIADELSRGLTEGKTNGLEWRKD